MLVIHHLNKVSWKNKKGEKTQIIFLYLALSTSQQNTYELHKCLFEDKFNYWVIKELLTTVSWVIVWKLENYNSMSNSHEYIFKKTWY